MRGRAVPEFAREDLRELIIQNYRVVYRVSNDRITVLAVLHGAMDLESARERRPWEF